MSVNYKKNIFGDVIGIIDNNGQEIAKYVYDAWGNHKTYVLNDGIFVDISTVLSYTQNGLNNKVIAQINPFRYRSYYYDSETNLYYLNSRYYDPETADLLMLMIYLFLLKVKYFITDLTFTHTLTTTQFMGCFLLP